MNWPPPWARWRGASVRRLPQGEQYYANSLRYITTTRLTAEEIHRIHVATLAAEFCEIVGMADLV